MARRTKEDSIKTRRMLLEAALDVFSEKSFSKVTINEIASRVGMTKGAVYWHFKSKNEILMKLIEEICLGSDIDFMERCGPPDTLSELREYYGKKIAAARKNERFLKIHTLMLRRYEWPEDVRRNVVNLLKSSFEYERTMVSNILHKAARAGTIREDVAANSVSTAFVSLFYGLILLVINEIITDDLGESLDFIYDAFKKELV